LVVWQLRHDLHCEFLHHYAVPHPAYPRVIDSGSSVRRNGPSRSGLWITPISLHGRPDYWNRTMDPTTVQLCRVQPRPRLVTRPAACPR
jgi:hypothetical protein